MLLLLCRCSLDDEVCVGAAKAKGGDAGEAGLVSRPVAALADDDGEVLKVDVGVGALRVDARGDVVALHGEGDLDEGRHAGRALEVAEVGLDGREHDARRPSAVVAPEDLPDGLDLDVVAEAGAGPVALDVREVCDVAPGAAVRLLEERLLGEAVGRGEALGAAVLVHSRACNHAVDAVAVGQRCAEALEHDHAAALGAHKAVRALVEREAVPVGGQCRRLGERQPAGGRQNRIHAASEAQLGFTVADRVAREVCRHC